MKFLLPAPYCSHPFHAAPLYGSMTCLTAYSGNPQRQKDDVTRDAFESLTRPDSTGDQLWSTLWNRVKGIPGNSGSSRIDRISEAVLSLYPILCYTSNIYFITRYLSHKPGLRENQRTIQCKLHLNSEV